jgi:hypothetical protein
MKKKAAIPVNKPAKPLIERAQRTQANTRADVKKTRDNYNPNNGPKQRSRKKAF